MKRIFKAAVSLSVLLTILLSFVPYSVYASPEEIAVVQPDAKKAGLHMTCEALSKDQIRFIIDQLQYTHTTIKNAVRIKVVTSEPIKHLYMVFDKPCRWTLAFPDGTQKQCGENDFLHEYIAFDEELSEFYIELPPDSCIADVYGFTDGNLPSWVQIWERPCDRADLMVMPTHADDEYLWFGGALPYYAGELGYKVQVVYLTDHYNAVHRKHELLSGLWAVGVRNYPVLTDKFKDVLATKFSLENAEAYFGRDNVTEFQVEMLRRFAPRVIIAHDINGEYGHGAHKLNAATLLDALKIYEDPTVYPESAEKYGVRKVQKCYLHLWNENRIVVQWSDLILEHFNGKTAYEMAVKGFSYHKSQLGFNLHINEDWPYDCRIFGLAYTTVGYDTPDKNDMFEHVDMTDEKEDENPENPEEVKQTTQAVSKKKKKTEELKLNKKIGITLFGRELMRSDVLVVSIAAVLLLAAIITVICLRRRE